MPSYLEQLTERPLAKPCEESWGAMTGDDKTRLCERCVKRVYNLSEMTRREAEIRLLNADGHPCIRYRQDGLGNLLMRNEPMRPRAHHSNTALVMVGALSVASLSTGAMAAPPSSPPSTAVSRDQCGKPTGTPSAAAPSAAPPTSAPPTPALMLSGAPPMVEKPAARGSLEVKSSKPRHFTIESVEFEAPVASIQLPPGKHEVVVYEAKKAVRTIVVTLKANEHQVLDLK